MIYCDYNASAPLNEKFFGAALNLPFANPSAQHFEGKKSLKTINNCRNFLLDHFNLKNTHDVIFHSGSTEGMNILIKNYAREKKLYFLYSKTDHSVAHQISDYLKDSDFFKVTSSGAVDFEDLEAKISKSIQSSKVILNYTWVSNESGAIWDLNKVLTLKNKYKEKLIVHVDATQSIAKVENYRELLGQLDFYSFSGHKFGALNGIGWSFISKDEMSNLPIFMHGGGQELGLRSSTQNIQGIYSLEFALKHLEKKFDYTNMEKKFLELKSFIVGIVSKNAVLFEPENKNLNTFLVYFKNIKSQVLIPAFDIAGISLGAGAACNSGALQKNQYLIALGLDEYSENSLRISFDPFINSESIEEFKKIFSKTLEKIFHGTDN